MKKNRILILGLVLFAAIILIGGGFWGFSSYQKRKITLAAPIFKGDAIAYLNTGLSMEEIMPVSDTKAKALPHQLVVKPGVYEIYGKAYSMNREGLYRFLLPGRENTQVIVYNDNKQIFMASISWLFSHGNEDNKLSYDAMEKKARREKLVVTCAKITNFAEELASEQGIDARQVTGVTNEEFNGYDDSHSLLEVRMTQSVWQVFDLDNNATFYQLVKKTKKYLNYIEFQKVVYNDNYQIERIASDPSVGSAPFLDKSTAYNYYFYSEQLMANEENLRKWYKRVLQIPLIEDNNGIDYYYFADEAKVTSFIKKARKLDQTDFMKRFYY